MKANLIKELYKKAFKGSIETKISFPEVIENDYEACEAFLESFEEQVRALAIKMGMQLHD